MEPILDVPLDQLRRRTSVKWRRYPSHVLPLWVAEMDARSCEPVAEALVRAVRDGDTGYAWPEGYAETVAGFASRRWGWQFDPATAVTVPDVMRGVAEVLSVVTDPGDAIVVNSPVYPPFYAFVDSVGRRPVEAPLGPDGRLDLTVLAETFATVTAQGRRAAYLLSNPHNPTGAVHSPEELRQVASLAAAHGVRVVVDEIHAPLVPPGQRHTAYLSLPGTDDAVSLVSASKAWNLAGLKCALLVPGPGAVADLERLPAVLGYAPSHLAVIAQMAAFEQGEPWLDTLLEELDDRRLLLGSLLTEHLPLVGYSPPEATYLAWLDCRRLGLGIDPAEHFLRHARVALNPGPEFGTGGAGHARLNLATSPEILTEAVARMAGSLTPAAPGPR